MAQEFIGSNSFDVLMQISICVDLRDLGQCGWEGGLCVFALRRRWVERSTFERCVSDVDVDDYIPYRGMV